ncbi:hypothetical protein SAMN05216358_0085 [Rhizobium sp. AN5]|nr:hypothetical protein [Rhizobium sp. AN5]SOC90066.1 hypothetical protein SAMN05216358_0085 [Rhizobium sp. AN5]
MGKLAMFLGFAVLLVVFAIGVYRTSLFLTNRSDKSKGDKE